MTTRTQYYHIMPTKENATLIGPYSFSNPLYVSNNILLITNYNEDNIKHGECITFWENGKKSEISNYKNGILDGSFKMFHPNGKLQLDTSYQNGLLEGQYKSYYSNGRLHIHRFYTNGQINGIDLMYEREPIEKTIY